MPPVALSRRRLLRGAFAAAAGGVAAVACGASPPSLPPNALDVRRFGAVGDGRNDDTAGLRRALAALASGQTLGLPAGHVFRHDDVLACTAEGATLTGGGTLAATSEERSALRVEADHVTIAGITLAVPRTTKRWSAPDQHRLYVSNHRGVTVRQVTVVGSAASGIFCDGPVDPLLDRVDVRDTRADGIHLTHGTTGARVISPTVHGSGDDGVAVVSYEQDGSPCRDVLVMSPTVRGTDGRGVSCVGGTDITYRDIDVEGSAAAGVYVACEGAPYDTFPAEHVLVDGGRVHGTNTDEKTDHGAVLVYAGRSGGAVRDTTIRGLTVDDTRRSASRQIGAVVDAGSMSDVVFQRLRLAPDPRPYQGDAPSTDFRLDHVTVDGRTVTA